MTDLLYLPANHNRVMPVFQKLGRYSRLYWLRCRFINAHRADFICHQWGGTDSPL